MSRLKLSRQRTIRRQGCRGKSVPSWSQLQSAFVVKTRGGKLETLRCTYERFATYPVTQVHRSKTSRVLTAAKTIHKGT